MKPAALADLDKAEALAATFGDSHSRLIRTLKLKSQVLGLANMFEQQESVNDQISTLQLELVMSDVDETRSLLRQLALPAKLCRSLAPNRWHRGEQEAPRRS